MASRQERKTGGPRGETDLADGQIAATQGVVLLVTRIIRNFELFDGVQHPNCFTEPIPACSRAADRLKLDPLAGGARTKPADTTSRNPDQTKR